MACTWGRRFVPQRPLVEGLGQRKLLVERRSGKGMRHEFVTLLLHVPGTGGPRASHSSAWRFFVPSHQPYRICLRKGWRGEAGRVASCPGAPVLCVCVCVWCW